MTGDSGAGSHGQMVETEQRMGQCLRYELNLRGEKGDNYEITDVLSPKDQDSYVTKVGHKEPVLDLSPLKKQPGIQVEP